MSKLISPSLALCSLFLFAALPADCRDEPIINTLKNDKIIATFQGSSLTTLHDIALDKTIEFAAERGNIEFTKGGMSTGAKKIEKGEYSLTFINENREGRLRTVFELKPGWRFISKQMFVTRTDVEEFHVEKVNPFVAAIPVHAAYTHVLDRDTQGTWAVFQRFASERKGEPDYGLFYVVQNPLMKWTNYYRHRMIQYEADMDWKTEWGEFACDPLCIGTFPLNGTLFPASPISESTYLADPEKAVKWAKKVDIAEILALQDCVRAFLMVKPEKSQKINVGWCENDYQIDVSTVEGRTEYKRIIDRSAEMGCDYILYAPCNNDVSVQKESTDAWGWENLLWLGMGQKIRKGEWDPATTEPLAPSIQEMLDYAAKKEIKLVAYVYPTLGFLQDPQWTAWTERVGGYQGVDMGERSFQDWFVKKLVDFQKKTGIGGYAFDHWYLNGGTSKYAKWNGMRRVLEELRKQLPDILIDGRQTHQYYGPWTCLSGIYPHPFGMDEQPASFAAAADLHTDRLSANHTRAMNWMFSMQAFCPIEVVPGFIGHQTQRSDGERVMRRDKFHTRDWDYLGWRYSLISSIATAPFNHVVNMIPARDMKEFKAFSKKEQKEFAGWLEWSDRELDILRNVRPIIGAPMIDQIDGTAAFRGEEGFVFLFNPNYQQMDAKFNLDHSIGLEEGDQFIIKEIYPQKDRLIGKPGSGVWTKGDTVMLPMEGVRAMVLEVMPLSRITQPLLFNLTGKAKLRGSTLLISDLTGEVGTEAEIQVAMAQKIEIQSVKINGKKSKFSYKGSLLTAKVRFEGEEFGHAQPVSEYDPEFELRQFKGEFSIPKRIFSQLKARKKAWPVDYTEDDLIAPWLAPWRLLLFINIADAATDMELALRINGDPIEIKQGNNAIYMGEKTFMGFYVDLSHLKADTKYKVEVDLPELSPGQFHGLYFENIETEFTESLFFE